MNEQIALGRELCRMRWHDFSYFVKVLSCLTTDDLITYAESYQAFVKAHTPNSDLTIDNVLQAWHRIVRQYGGAR